MSTTAGLSAEGASLPIADLEDESSIDTFDEGIRLVGTLCDQCGKRMLGARVVCSACVSTEVSRVALQSTGTLYSFTTMRVGADQPRVLGYVDLDDGVRTLTDLREGDVPLVPDARVELRTSGASWWFTAVAGS